MKNDEVTYRLFSPFPVSNKSLIYDHVMLDTEAIMLSILPADKREVAFSLKGMERKRYVWGSIFKMKKIEKWCPTNYTFRFMASTDGVSISLHYIHETMMNSDTGKAKKRNKFPKSKNQKRQEWRDKYLQNALSNEATFQSIKDLTPVGCDPGLRDLGVFYSPAEDVILEKLNFRSLRDDTGTPVSEHDVLHEGDELEFRIKSVITKVFYHEDQIRYNVNAYKRNGKTMRLRSIHKQCFNYLSQQSISPIGSVRNGWALVNEKVYVWMPCTVQKIHNNGRIDIKIKHTFHDNNDHLILPDQPPRKKGRFRNRKSNKNKIKKKIKGNILRYSAKQRDFESGRNRYKKKQKEMRENFVPPRTNGDGNDGNTDDDTEDNRSATIDELEQNLQALHPKSINVTDFDYFVQRRFEYIAQVREFYTNPLFRRHRLWSHLNRRKSMLRFLTRFRTIFGGPEKKFIAWGNYRRKNCHRGLPSTIGKGFIRAFERFGYKVYIIDEYKTSRICPKCHHKTKKCLYREFTNKHGVTKESLVHGLLRCCGCFTWYDRDVSASINIYTKANDLLQHAKIGWNSGTIGDVLNNRSWEKKVFQRRKRKRMRRKVTVVRCQGTAESE